MGLLQEASTPSVSLSQWRLSTIGEKSTFTQNDSRPDWLRDFNAESRGPWKFVINEAVDYAQSTAGEFVTIVPNHKHLKESDQMTVYMNRVDHFPLTTPTFFQPDTVSVAFHEIENWIDSVRQRGDEILLGINVSGYNRVLTNSVSQAFRDNIYSSQVYERFYRDPLRQNVAQSVPDGHIHASCRRKDSIGRLENIDYVKHLAIITDKCQREHICEASQMDPVELLSRLVFDRPSVDEMFSKGIAGDIANELSAVSEVKPRLPDHNNPPYGLEIDTNMRSWESFFKNGIFIGNMMQAVDNAFASKIPYDRKRSGFNLAGYNYNIIFQEEMERIKMFVCPNSNFRRGFFEALAVFIYRPTRENT